MQDTCIQSEPVTTLLAPPVQYGDNQYISLVRFSYTSTQQWEGGVQARMMVYTHNHRDCGKCLPVAISILSQILNSYLVEGLGGGGLSPDMW